MDTPFRHQSTLAQPISVSGFGFWSGDDVTIEFRPAAENSGRVFVRTDLPDQPRIAALIQNRIPGPRRTTLQQDDCSVEMVEHVLAALAGLQIDNCEIHVNRAEMPGMDGSSRPFVAALQQAGKTTQTAIRKTLKVVHPIRVENGDAWIEATPVTEPVTRFTYQLDYADAMPAQSFSLELTPSGFVEQVADARTFLLESEANQLREQGLGDRVSFADILVFGPNGPIDNTLRFPDECARHKTLDMIGDFALSGADLIGQFVASKSGHLLNSQLVLALTQANRNTIANSVSDRPHLSNRPNRQSA